MSDAVITLSCPHVIQDTSFNFRRINGVSMKETRSANNRNSDFQSTIFFDVQMTPAPPIDGLSSLEIDISDTYIADALAYVLVKPSRRFSQPAPS